MSASDVKTAGRSLRQISDPATKRVLETILSNIDILKNSVDKLENPADIEWFDAKLQNGWVQFDDNFFHPKFALRSDGFVSLSGLIKNGTTTTGTLMFNLPKGFRPERTALIETIAGAAIARIDIRPDGDVVIQSGTNSYFSLDNIYFQAYR